MDWWQFGIGLAIIVGSIWAIFRTYYEKQESLLKEQIEVLKNQLPKASELESRVNIIEKSYEKEMEALKEEYKREKEEFKRELEQVLEDLNKGAEMLTELIPELIPEQKTALKK